MGLLDSLRNIRYQPTPFSQGLLNMGAQMLSDSGPSYRPRGFASTLGRGLGAFAGGAQENMAFNSAMQQQALANQLAMMQYDPAYQRQKIMNKAAAEAQAAQMYPNSRPLYGFSQGNKYSFANPYSGEVIKSYDISATPTSMLTSGMTPTPEGGVQVTPGWSEAKGTQEAYKQAGKEGQTVVQAVDPKGRPFWGKKSQLNASVPNLIPSLINVESGGNVNAVSPAGARGPMQIMPETAADPGFGVKPMQNNSVEEQIRFGSDYLRALVNKYGNLPEAISAFHMGPGNVDKNGITDPTYVNNVLSGAGQTNAPSAATMAGQTGSMPGVVMGPSISETESMKAEGQAEKARSQAQIQAQLDLPVATDEANYVVNLIDRLISHPGLSGVVGMKNTSGLLGSAFGTGGIPGTTEADFETLRQQVKGKTFLQAYQRLRGAQAITDIEGQKATDALARLETAQSENAFKQALTEYRDIIKQGLNRLRERAGQVSDQPDDEQLRREYEEYLRSFNAGQ